MERNTRAKVKKSNGKKLANEIKNQSSKTTQKQMTENVTSRSCSVSPKQKSRKLQKRAQSVFWASISPVRYRINDITGRREFDNSNSNSTVAHAVHGMSTCNSSSHKATQLDQASDLASDGRELVDEESYEVDGLKLSVNAQENEEFETDEFEAAEVDEGSQG